MRDNQRTLEQLKRKVADNRKEIFKPKLLPHDTDLDWTYPSRSELETRRAFGNRRKMLRQSLKEFGGSNLLKLANIKDYLRAQDLSTSEFCKLSKLFAQTN